MIILLSLLATCLQVGKSMMMDEFTSPSISFYKFVGFINNKEFDARFCHPDHFIYRLESLLR